MTHEQIEEYLKDRNLDWQQYQLALDAMAYAEQKAIERACSILYELNRKELRDQGIRCRVIDVQAFKKSMEE